MKSRSQGNRPDATALEEAIRRDVTKYKAAEVAHAICDGIPEQLEECVNKHLDIIKEPEFFVIMLIGEDNILKTVIRRKFYAYPFMPKPRPNQSVWVYKRSTGELEFLWALPAAEAMAHMSSMTAVDPKLVRMKRWCDYFFDDGKFAQHIRREYDQPGWLTESEYLDLHISELTKAVPDDSSLSVTDAANSSKIESQKIMDLAKSSVNQQTLDVVGQA